MGAVRALFQGTKEEGKELYAAIMKNCTCKPGEVRSASCEAPHDMIKTQRDADHMLFARRISKRFLDAEFTGDTNGSD